MAGGLRDLVGRWRWVVVTLHVVILVAALASFSTARFRFSFEPEGFLTPAEQALLERESAGPPREFLVAILTPRERVPLSRDFLRTISDRLTELPEVSGVVSEALLPQGAEPDLFRTTDGASLLMIQLEKEGALSIFESRSLMRGLDETLRSALAGQSAGHSIGWEWVGSSPTRIALHEAFRADTLRVIIPVLLLLLFLPYFFFGSLGYLVLAASVGLFTVATTFSLYARWGTHFTYFSLTLAPLLFCLAILDTLFLVDRWFALRRDGLTPSEASRTAARDLLTPCTLTSVTTLAGFLSLALFSKTPILQEYGRFASFGIAVAWASTFLLVPAAVTFWKGTPAAGRSAAPLGFLRSSIPFCLGRPRRVILLFALATLAVIPFLGQLSIEGAPEKIFSAGHPTQRSIDRLKTHLGSLTPLTLTLRSTRPERSTRLRWALFVKGLEGWLEKQPFVARVLSPLSFMPPPEALSDKTGTASREPLYLRMKRFERDLEKLPLGDIAGRSAGWITADETGRLQTVRIEVWPKQLSPEEHERFLKYLANFERTMMAEFEWEMGGPYLLRRTVETRFLREALSSLLSSGLLIILLTLIPLRSIRLAFIFVVVNALPLILLGGLTAAVGIPVTIALIGLPTILIGLFVDNTIHILWELKRGRPVEEVYAVKGRVLVGTTLLLTIGFGGQLLSGFIGNRQFGGLAAAGLLMALAADLWLLPALAATVVLKGSLGHNTTTVGRRSNRG